MMDTPEPPAAGRDDNPESSDSPQNIPRESTDLDRPLATAAPLPAGLLSRWPWLTFCLPLLVFLVIGSFEPRPPQDDAGAENAQPSFSLSGAVPYEAYPIIYTAKIALTTAAIIFVLPGMRTFPFQVSPGAVVLGVVGAVVWIALAEWKPLPPMLQAIGLGWLTDAGERSAFNPLAELAAAPVWAYLFLAIRFFGLAAVVPVAEEFFWRGLVMRFFISDDWWRAPLGQWNRAGLAAAVILPVLMHPGEIAAAAVWFSGVAWWAVRTGRIWDCVVIHAVTNLLLGVYVVSFGAWHLM